MSNKTPGITLQLQTFVNFMPATMQQGPRNRSP